ncbi:MAG: hypothetical protein KatS3mg132_148 [Limisphaera sp.]|nr:MAG: hypothetical protein KatS3mg132_148 [Limisphaera sp.]
MKDSEKWQGVVVPMVTPVTAEGRLDEAVVDTMVGFLVEHGVDGLFVLGTTGEGASVPREDALRLVRRVVTCAAGRVPVYAGLGELTDPRGGDGNAYLERGASVLVARPPVQLPAGQLPGWTEDLLNSLEGPVMLYNIPTLNGVSVPLELLEAWVGHPRLVGIKDSENDAARLRRLLERLGGPAGFLDLCGRGCVDGRGASSGCRRDCAQRGEFDPGGLRGHVARGAAWRLGDCGKVCAEGAGGGEFVPERAYAGRIAGGLEGGDGGAGAVRSVGVATVVAHDPGRDRRGPVHDANPATARMNAGPGVRPVLGVTMGDPAGVGPELAVRTLALAEVHEFCVPVLFAGGAVLDRLSEAGLGGLPWPRVSPDAWGGRGRPEQPVIVDCGEPGRGGWLPGEVSEACGRAAWRYIEMAIRSALAGQVDGVVTLPVHKVALRRAGVPYPGHTEIFTALTGAKRTCMMLHSEQLTVSMVTTHIGYAEVPDRLSVERILDVIELTGEACRRLLGREPRLAVCGLNPHAGENGLFGCGEEERFIRPAVEAARQRGWRVEGPLPPDTAFVPFQRGRFDAWVTMYHDQGHIPFKMLAFDTGVNVTLGLPIVRTSVDHGTAFDIAWQGMARDESLRAALRVAARLAAAHLK